MFFVDIVVIANIWKSQDEDWRQQTVRDHHLC